MIKIVAITNVLVLTVTTYGAFMFAATPITQDKPIKVKFEVDGKELNQPFKILLSVDGSTDFEPTISNGRFIFPPELRNYEKIHLRFKAGEYDLDFGEVNFSKFSGEMVFGVDKEPFDEANIVGAPPPGKELMGIYYIRFEPDKGAATMLVISEYH